MSHKWVCYWEELAFLWAPRLPLMKRHFLDLAMFSIVLVADRLLLHQLWISNNFSFQDAVGLTGCLYRVDILPFLLLYSSIPALTLTGYSAWVHSLLQKNVVPGSWRWLTAPQNYAYVQPCIISMGSPTQWETGKWQTLFTRVPWGDCPSLQARKREGGPKGTESGPLDDSLSHWFQPRVGYHKNQEFNHIESIFHALKSQQVSPLPLNTLGIASCKENITSQYETPPWHAICHMRKACVS